MRSDSGIKGGHLLLAFVGGAAAGVLTGLLVAPASGAETWHTVMDTLRGRRDATKRVPPALRQAYSTAADAARQAFFEAYQAQELAGDGER